MYTDYKSYEEKSQGVHRAQKGNLSNLNIRKEGIFWKSDIWKGKSVAGRGNHTKDLRQEGAGLSQKRRAGAWRELKTWVGAGAGPAEAARHLLLHNGVLEGLSHSRLTTLPVHWKFYYVHFTDKEAKQLGQTRYFISHTPEPALWHLAIHLIFLDISVSV